MPRLTSVRFYQAVRLGPSNHTFLKENTDQPGPKVEISIDDQVRVVTVKSSDHKNIHGELVTKFVPVTNVIEMDMPADAVKTKSVK